MHDEPKDRTFPLRMPHSTYETAVRLAHKEGISLREYLLRMLRERIQSKDEKALHGSGT
jgi:predicted HicB family RNase H-like nuclease